MEDKEIAYWSNGNLWYEFSSLNGVDHGLCQVWYDNGVKECEEEFVHGLHHGRFVYWRIDGSLALLRLYKKNENHGVDVRFEY